jgi:outer membrane biosynthesis protein TonB
MRLDPAACGAPIPLVRATPSGQVRDTVFPVEMLDRLPDLMRVDPPSYPAVMTRTGFDAFVVLSVLVEANGQPSRVMVARTSRHRGVDSAIRESMLRSWYRPALRRGRPVPVMLCQTVAVNAEVVR